MAQERIPVPARRGKFENGSVGVDMFRGNTAKIHDKSASQTPGGRKAGETSVPSFTHAGHGYCRCAEKARVELGVRILGVGFFQHEAGFLNGSANIQERYASREAAGNVQLLPNMGSFLIHFGTRLSESKRLSAKTPAIRATSELQII